MPPAVPSPDPAMADRSSPGAVKILCGGRRNPSAPRGGEARRNRNRATARARRRRLGLMPGQRESPAAGATFGAAPISSPAVRLPATRCCAFRARGVAISSLSRSSGARVVCMLERERSRRAEQSGVRLARDHPCRPTQVYQPRQRPLAGATPAGEGRRAAGQAGGNPRWQNRPKPPAQRHVIVGDTNRPSTVAANAWETPGGIRWQSGGKWPISRRLAPVAVGG